MDGPQEKLAASHSDLSPSGSGATHASASVAIPPPFVPVEESARSNPFDRIQTLKGTAVRQVWAVGGGKGGVGKSLVTSSLAITLAKMGHRVVAADLDLGGANLHTTLGVDLPKQTLGDFLGQRVQKLDECLIQTGIPNLSLISGAGDPVGAANISLDAKVALLQALRNLPADFVLVDLGAGTSYHTIDFFIGADLGLLTLLPEPTSIENAYRFIKSVYYRRLFLSKHLAPIRPLIEAAMDSKNTMGIRSPSDLFREANRHSPELAMRMKEEIEAIRPKLLVNQARTQTDVDIGYSVKTVTKKYFGIEMDYIGYLDYDSAVWQSVRRKRPMLLEFPNSRLVASIEKITQHLLTRHGAGTRGSSSDIPGLTDT